MTQVLPTAAALLVLIGLIHSYLGERYILIRLFRAGKVPHLFGGDTFTKGTLRFAWHMTSIAWWGFAWLLLMIESDADIQRTVLQTVSVVFLLTGILAFGFTRGRHISWLVFWSVAGLAYYASYNVN